MHSIFRNKIFELLKEKGMSQKEFAQRTGIAESSIAALLMNALSSKNEEMSVQLAWEYALLNIETKYLAYFYKGLRNI